MSCLCNANLASMLPALSHPFLAVVVVAAAELTVCNTAAVKPLTPSTQSNKCCKLVTVDFLSFSSFSITQPPKGVVTVKKLLAWTTRLAV